METQALLAQHVLNIVRDLDKGFMYDESGDTMDTPHTFLEEVLDVVLHTDLSGNLIGGTLAVSLGGPNIFINLGTSQVEGHWGKDQFTKHFSDATCTELWEAIQELS